jgi:cupin 2 domain-containing protein
MDSPILRGNLFATAAPATGERFDPLVRFGNTAVERIVSSAEPESDVYDQTQDEWVVLLTGQARLEVEGESIELSAGDYLSLPAHTRHRVLFTSPGAIWLAVHVAR